jgi:hypothetical protein
MKTKLPIFVGVVLILMLISSVLMGIYWLPDVFNYLSSYLSGGAFLAFKLLCGVIGAGLLGILLSAMAFPRSMAKDLIFTSKAAKWIKGQSIALFADCLLLCFAAVWLIWAGERLLMPALLFVGLIGIMVALAVYIISDYIARAAVLKEEADLTL